VGQRNNRGSNEPEAKNEEAKEKGSEKAIIRKNRVRHFTFQKFSWLSDKFL